MLSAVSSARRSSSCRVESPAAEGISVRLCKGIYRESPEIAYQDKEGIRESYERNLRRLLAVNAHSFTYAGETVFDSAQPVPYIQAHFWDSGMVIESGEGEGKVYVRDLRDRQFQRN